jgi:hypothetical protein
MHSRRTIDRGISKEQNIASRSRELGSRNVACWSRFPLEKKMERGVLSPEMTLRDISLVRNNEVAFGVKRTPMGGLGWVAQSRLTQGGHARLRIAARQTDPEPISPVAKPCCNH